MVTGQLCPPTWGRPPWRACRVPGATPPHADWLWLQGPEPIPVTAPCPGLTEQHEGGDLEGAWGGGGGQGVSDGERVTLDASTPQKAGTVLGFSGETDQ